MEFFKKVLSLNLYIFEYNSYDIELKEERKLIYSQINQYIKEKNCNTQKNRQILRNGEESIGTLIIPNIKRQLSERINIQSKIHQKQSSDMLNNNNNIHLIQTEIININNADDNYKKENKMINNQINTLNNIDEGKELLKVLIYI